MSSILTMTQWSLRTTVTPDTGEIMKTFWYFRESLKFRTKWYTKLCNSIDPFLRKLRYKVKFSILKEKRPKKALALKGLNNFEKFGKNTKY